MTVIYEVGISVVVGSIATAEERQLGTIAWQLQLPTAAWQQVAVKIGTVFGVSLLLAVGVPTLLVPSIWPAERPVIEMPIVLAVAMTAVSMYVSSLCATTIRAFVASAVAISVVLWVVLAPTLWTGRQRGSIALLATLVVASVGLAMFNHKPEQPSRARVARQTLSLAALTGLGVFVLQYVGF
jgi:hypothetical protein